MNERESMVNHGTYACKCNVTKSFVRKNLWRFVKGEGLKSV